MELSQLESQLQLQIFSPEQIVCRICGDSIPRYDLKDHLRIHRRAELSKETLINCDYCKNKMPTRSMAAHLLRKHNISTRDTASPAVIQKQNEIDDINKCIQLIDQQIVKRPRYDAGRTIAEALDEAVIPRPQTPPFENPTEPSVEEIVSLPIVQFDNKVYNLVHVSDYELNKLMMDGRIRIHEGYLYMNDSDHVEKDEN